MTNGNDALEYVIERAERLAGKMDGSRPDFSKCPVGAEPAEDQYTATLILLQMMAINLRNHQRYRSPLRRGATASGWVGIVGTIVYLFAKLHGIDLP